MILGKEWQGLTITATFVTSEKSTVALMGLDNMIVVPPEATAIPTGKDEKFKIVFCGIEDGKKRISIDLDYKVHEHTEIDGDPAADPTPGQFEQFVNEVKADRIAADAAAQAAGQSEVNAGKSEKAAKESEISAADSAKRAEDAAGVLEGYETEAKGYADAAKKSAGEAKVSEDAAKLSETNAKGSEDAAKLSETNAKASEVESTRIASEVKTQRDEVVEIKNNLDFAITGVYERAAEVDRDALAAAQDSDAAQKSARNAKISENITKTAAAEAVESADIAQKASDAVLNMGVGSVTLQPGSEATVRKLEYSSGSIKLEFGIPSGEKGEKGDGFKIVKTYPSINAMEADYNTPDVKVGQFVAIATDDMNDPDNAKVFIKTETGWSFQVDLSGAQGIQGLSAYELAVQNGFQGTLEEWLNSLKGKDGASKANEVSAVVPEGLPEETTPDVQSILNALNNKPSGVQSDWSVNDPNDPAYVKNRFGGYSVAQDLLEEKEYPFVDNYDIYMSVLPQVIDITVGDTYTVRFGEAVVDTVAKSLEGQPYIGNASIIGAPGDTGEDFLIASAPDLGTQMATKIPSTSIIVGLKGPQDVQIPSKYMKGKPGQIIGRGELFNQAKEASGWYSHAEGDSTEASGEASHAEGKKTTASDDYTHAEGSNTTASGLSSHAEGWYTTASGSCSHAEGNHATASGDSSHAECDSTEASGSCSHAEGYYTKASGNYGSHAEGYYTKASGNYGSHAEGYYTKASGSCSHAEGGYLNYNGQYLDDWHHDGFTVRAPLADGTNSHAEGMQTHANGYSSHTEGYRTYASGNYGSHAEGYYTTASGGFGSHAEGQDTTASGGYSHAEGDETTASGSCSHAEGYYTTASGGFGSHAEGQNTTASDEASHAEGYQTTASGEDSHAEGDGTTASGENSHAEGYQTTASGDFQHVQGKYNIPDTDTKLPDGTPQNKYAHIVGNGNYDATEPVYSNAHTLDWEGNGWFQNDVLVGGADMDDPNAISLKKLSQKVNTLAEPILITIDVESRPDNSFWTMPINPADPPEKRPTSNDIINLVNAGKEVRLHFFDTVTNTGDQLYVYETTVNSVPYFRRNVVTTDKVERINIGVQFNGEVKFEQIPFTAWKGLGIKGATVGQIAKIKAVGPDGVPTEWKSGNVVESVNGNTGIVTLKASDVGALAQEELQTAVNDALAQAKASGEFKGDIGPAGGPGPAGKSIAWGSLTDPTAVSDTHATIANIIQKHTRIAAPVKNPGVFKAGDIALLPGQYNDAPRQHYVMIYGIDVVRGSNLEGYAMAVIEEGLPGAAGKTPIRGTDYWTSADQVKIVQDTLNALPKWDGGGSY